MSVQREQILERAHAMDIYEGDDFMRDEERAIALREFVVDGVPTIAQLPEIATLYMQVYANLPPDQIALGLDVRRVRAEEAAGRQNSLFITHRALAMDGVALPSGEIAPLDVTRELRARQLGHLAVIAREPYVDLRLVQDSDRIISSGAITQMQFSDGTTSVYASFGKRTHYLTSPEETAQYDEAFARLHHVAFSPEATLDIIRDFRAEAS